MSRKNRSAADHIDWLRKRGLEERPLHGHDTEGIARVIVIPVLAESGHLFSTLKSLAGNPTAMLDDTLVICVINNRAEPHAAADQIADNQKSLREIELFLQGRGALELPSHKAKSLRLAFIDASSPGNELAPKMGVGEARRIGLDRGLAVLCANDRPNGVMISLDADTTVEPNYLGAIADHFVANDTGGAVVDYAHTVPEDSEQREAILLYELFLRYHELGLRAAGSPYAFPTIGSTIVVRGYAYVAAGGMNRKQAGEDFYFIQQLVKTSSVSRIDTTTVFPSARASDRVPFGTGAGIGRHMAGDQGLRTAYNPEAYRVLGKWLALVQDRLDADAGVLLEGAAAIDSELEVFMIRQGLEEVWPKLRSNAPDLRGFESQVHRWFDGFKSLKLIHHLRDNGYPLMPIEEAVRELLFAEDISVGSLGGSGDLPLLLDRVRQLCRG